ncbi:MAG: DNA-formamidopyrimidine glycosylase family protein [Promethearchaeota archaeon]
MPELPEIQAICEYLNSVISEEVVTEVKTFQHTVIRTPSAREFEKSLLDSTLDQIERMGKILRFSFHKSELFLKLYVDHGLTGRLGWLSNSWKIPAKTVFTIKFSNDRKLIYHDSRFHGAIWLFYSDNESSIEYPAVIERFGPDIFQVSEDEFNKRLQKFNGEIKGILTNQKFVTGIGNAYADEILFKARIHPFTRRPQLTEKEKSTLYLACREILTKSANKIAYILNNTQKLNNKQYWRQQIFQIHLKGKEPCPICGNSISTIKAKRLTNFCRNCQIPKNRNFI